MVTMAVVAVTLTTMTLITATLSRCFQYFFHGISI